MSMVAVTVVVVLGIFVAALISLWDREHAPPHPVSRWVQCPRYQRAARVDFIERVQTGMEIRTVQHCPLRSPNERCGERCVWEATIYPTP